MKIHEITDNFEQLIGSQIFTDYKKYVEATYEIKDEHYVVIVENHRNSITSQVNLSIKETIHFLGMKLQKKYFNQPYSTVEVTIAFGNVVSHGNGFISIEKCCGHVYYNDSMEIVDVEFYIDFT